LHAKDIFGADCIYFDVKKMIRNALGEGTIPDGYLVNFKERTFYIVEVELCTHPEYDHISKQIGRFISALKDYKTSRKIARILKDYIEEDIIRKKFVRDKIGDRELYQFFLEDILENVKKQNYHTIVIIDEITEKISEACSILAKEPKILEFKTFVRENVGDLRVHCHFFNPLVSEKMMPPEEDEPWTSDELKSHLKDSMPSQRLFFGALVQVDKEPITSKAVTCFMNKIAKALPSEGVNKKITGKDIAGARAGLALRRKRLGKERLIISEWNPKEKDYIYSIKEKYKQLIKDWVKAEKLWIK